MIYLCGGVMFYLYKITNLLDGKVYIGQSNKENERWRRHKYFGRNPEKTGQHIHRAMAKYGSENFIYEVIARSLTDQDANETEKQLIDQYDSRNPDVGYNVAPGGDVPWNRGLPKELNPLTGIPRSEEVKKRISKATIGKIMPPCSDERKEKMSKKYKGRTLPKEWVEKIAASNRGQIRSEESRLKISQSHIGVQSGEKHPGAKLNWETVRKIRQEHAGGIATPRQLSEKYGVGTTNIYDILNHKIWKE